MADITVESVTNVVGQIYEAAYDHERWLDVVTGMRDLLGGARACIVRFDLDSVDAVSTVPDPELGSPQAVAAHMREPLLHAASTRVPPGAIYRRTQIAGDGFFQSELWQEWFRPRDMYDGLVSNLMCSNDSFWLFDVHRGAQQEAFDAAEIDLTTKLMPHVLRAGEISRSIQNVATLASAFSHLPFGILLVDGHRRVHQMNDAAEAMLSRLHSPLGLKSGLVEATGLSDASRLRQLVLDACSSTDGVMPGLGGTFLLPSDDTGRPRIALSVAPFASARSYGLASARCAVIMIREVAAHSPAGLEEHIREAFGLTGAEARLAAALSAGRSLKQAAAAQNIQFSTARYYLEQIFRKTGVHRQSELIALLTASHPFYRLG